MSKKRPTQKHTPRINKLDWLQAILRHPQYIQDYEYIQKLKAKARTKDDLQRLHTETNRIERKWGGPVLQFMFCEIKDIKYRPFCEELLDSVRVVTNTKPSDKYSPLRGMLDFLNDSANPEKNRYLTLEIDLWENKNKLMKEVERLIAFFCKHTSLPKGKVRETTCNPWEVYDQHRNGKSLLKIAKEKFGFKKNPAYDEDAKKKYEQVVYAYNKAKKMIKQVTPSR